MSRRTDRIANELQAELARLLREEVTDPRIGLVSLTRLDVAPDLSHAVVYYSTLQTLDDEAMEALDDGLHSAASFLRRRAAQKLPFKRMPAFRFRHDPSVALGAETLDLLRELSPSEPRAGEESRDEEGER